MPEHHGSRLSRILLACLCCLAVTSHTTVADVQAQGRYTVACRSDTNNSGSVDLMDLVAVSTHYAPFVPTTMPAYDVNRDGYIDLFDLVLMALHYGEPCCLFASETSQHYHEPRQCVEFQVVHTGHTDADTRAFLDSALQFHGHFAVLIDRDLWWCWPQVPYVFFDGSTVRVWGVIYYYPDDDAPQIKLQSCGDIEILE